MKIRVDNPFLIAACGFAVTVAALSSQADTPAMRDGQAPVAAAPALR